MTEELSSLARRLAMPYYEDALPAHDEFHAKRVRNLSVRLADECGTAVDRAILSAAAWLHDIGRPRERVGEIDHHDKWATTKAAALLDAEGVASARIDAITHCIRAHSIRSSSPEPETIEAKLLFDADKLDAAGARGIVRLACIIGERSGRTGEQYAVIDDATASDTIGSDRPDVTLLRKWARERLDRLYTPPAKQLGTARWEFMEAFFDRFADELGVDGNR